MRLFGYIYILISIVCIATGLFYWHEEQRKEYIIVNSRQGYDPGMFSVFNTVIGSLYLYDQGDYAGLTVDFEERGCYYDSAHGKNWWDYYCEPLCLGDAHHRKMRRYSDDKSVEMAMFTEHQLSRQQVHHLIKKYIKVRGTIVEKVEQFVGENFKDNFIIGVHYRGTDKIIEAHRVNYEAVLESIQKHIKDLPSNEYGIFIATDEQPFLEYMRSKFPGKVMAAEAYRSQEDKPVHYAETNRFERGEQALIDALLLSNCHLLIRTSSNLSLWASYFNPDLPVELLNDRIPIPTPTLQSLR